RDDLTSRSYAIFGFPLALCARRASSIASRLPGTNRLGFQPSLAVSDSDVDNALELASIQITRAALYGRVVVNDDGTVSYTHDGEESGSDSLTYTIKDIAGAPSNIATVTLTVTPVNDAPVANDDSAAVAEGATKTINLLANDNDADSALDLSSIEITNAAIHGRVEVNGDGTVSYTHDGGESTSDSFTYTINDREGEVSNVATVNLTVNPVNDLPIAANDNATVNKGDTVAIDLAANDSDSDSALDLSSIQITSAATHGRVEVNGDGTVSYTHDGGENTSDRFSYTISDTEGAVSSIAIVTLTMTLVDTAPIAVADWATTVANTPVLIPTLANDNAVGGGALSITQVTKPANGTVTIATDGQTVSYRPAVDYVGDDNFTYSILDGRGNTTSGTPVNVTVTPYQEPGLTYYVLEPNMAGGSAQVVSLVDDNTITMDDGQQLSLKRYESGEVLASDLVQGMDITGTLPFAIGGSTNATDMPVPAAFAGTEFVIPHQRGTHTYYLLSLSGIVNATVDVGGVSSTFSLPQGVVVPVDAGSNNGIAGRITVDEPILVSHSNTFSQDAYPVPPATLDIVGTRSSSAHVGALSDATTVWVYADNGESISFVLNGGEKKNIILGSSTLQGRGSALHIVADKAIAAVQYADGDGGEQTAFLSPRYFGKRYAIPVDAQYAAVNCLTPDTEVTLYEAAAPVSTQLCQSDGVAPGKVYFGSKVNGANIGAGAYIEATNPVSLIYEMSSTNDEHMLLGTRLPTTF
ncbi:MAG: cadherin-like domain-containing protein, partial [Candidatus Sedimenticola sp. (ex Thyasira tokunagai)]